MKLPFYVIKLYNPGNGAVVGYWRRDSFIPRLHNTEATRFSDPAEARGIALGVMPDHEFGRFMADWRVKPRLQIVKVTR